MIPDQSYYHPTDLVRGGKTSNDFSIKDLKDAIPAHCWKPSYLMASGILLRDVFMCVTTAYLASKYIPQIENQPFKVGAWLLYGWLQGLIFTGLWVIGHECGHGSYFPSKLVNDSVGFILHSFELTPYFSWQSTHRRHHIYANNMKNDHNYVPPRRQEYLESFKRKLERVDDLAEDMPLYTFARIICQQILGFPCYLLFDITASRQSLPSKKNKLFGNSHFDPWGALFRQEEVHLIIASDLGLAAMAYLLYQYYATQNSALSVFLLYGQPYLWVNHWIVMITYLHHTHPEVPKFEHEAWTFIKGATATVDRDMGFIGRHFFHNISEYHVSHHLFSRIPCYHAEEATAAIVPLLGTMYRKDKRSFFTGIWEAFTRCAWVEPDQTHDPKTQALWFRAGPSPPLRIRMAG